MHHPHVPHELKDFGKHLFATFLGLLMALGLEQWREHHHDAKVAREALLGVKSELISIRDDLRKHAPQAEEHVKVAEQKKAILREVLQARLEKRPLNLPEMLKNWSGTELNFHWHAWDSAKTLGLLRHLRPDQVDKLSRFYGGMQRVQGIQDAMISSYTNLQAIFSANVPELQSLSNDRLHALLAEAEAGRNLKAFTLRIHQEMPKQIDELLKVLEG